MKKMLILSIVFSTLDLTICASDYPGNPGEPGVGNPPETFEEETSSSTATSSTLPVFNFGSTSVAEEKFTLDGGLYPAFDAFSPDGTKVYTIKILKNQNYQIRVWDTSNGAHIKTLDLDEKLRHVEWNPNNSEIIAASINKSILWKIPG